MPPFRLRTASLLIAGLQLAAAVGLRGGTEHNCSMPTTVPTLYDTPVSNNGARCRIIIYKKNLTLEEDIAIRPPSDLGGLKSAAYLALNPQGKMPLLVTSHGNIPESDTIARYLLDAFASAGPSFTPSRLEARTKSDLLCRLHDVYITSIQACMYREAPPFGVHHSRYKALQDLQKQLQVLDSNADASGPYIAGSELSLADATVFPTLVFVTFMLPKFVDDWDAERVVGKRLMTWFQWIREHDEVFARVWKEISEALLAWDANGRWDRLLYAGGKDTLARTIFDRILGKEIPSDVVFEDDDVLVFKDIKPQVCVHRNTACGCGVVPLCAALSAISRYRYVYIHSVGVTVGEDRQSCHSSASSSSSSLP